MTTVIQELGQAPSGKYDPAHSGGRAPPDGMALLIQVAGHGMTRSFSSGRAPPDVMTMIIQELREPLGAMTPPVWELQNLLAAPP
jgi:hypothetical protein